MSEGKKTKRILCGVLCAALVVGCIGGGIWWEGRKETKKQKTFHERNGLTFSNSIKDYQPEEDVINTSKYKKDKKLNQVKLTSNYKNISVKTDYDFKYHEKYKKKYKDILLDSTSKYVNSSKKNIDKDDYVSIDVEILKNGKIYQDMTVYDYIVPAAEKNISYIPPLIGKKVGNTIDYPTIMQNQKVISHIKINKVIKKEVLTQKSLTDKYIQEHFYDMYGVSTVKDWNNLVNEEYKERLLVTKNYRKSELVADYLLKNEKVNFTKKEWNNIVNKRKSLIKKYIVANNLSCSEEEYFSNTLLSNLENHLKLEYILLKISNENNIQITKKGYEKYKDAFVFLYGDARDGKNLLNAIGDEELKRNYLANQTLSFIASNARLNEGNKNPQISPFLYSKLYTYSIISIVD